jgi:hypothetical protein
MTQNADFQTRWSSMSDEKRQDILEAVRASGKLPADRLGDFPHLPELRDMMDCLCKCEEAYDEAVEKCKDSPDPATCKAAARSKLTKCCSNC